MATAQQISNALRIENTFDILNAGSPYNVSFYSDLTDWSSLGILVANGDTVDIICKVISPIGGVPYENAGFATDDFSSPDMTLSVSLAPQFTLPTFTGTNTPINGAYQYILKTRVRQGSSGQIQTTVTQTATVSLPQITTSVLIGDISAGDIWTASYLGVDISYTVQIGDDKDMAAIGLQAAIFNYILANPASDWAIDLFATYDTASVLFHATANNTPFTVTCTYTPIAPYTIIDVTKTFQFDLPKDVNPTLELTETWDCATATYKSVDTSNYCFNGCANGYSVTNIERAHTVYPPLASAQNSVSANAETILLGAPNNQLWTGTYQVTLSVIVTLVKGDCTIITHLSTNTEQKVICDDLLCGLYCSLKKLYSDFKYNLGNNTTRTAQIQAALIRGGFAYNMAKQARLCSDEGRVEQYVKDFYDFTGTDPNCDCCKDENSPVVPTSVLNGTDGANGLTPNFRVVNDLFQYQYPGGGWTTLYDFSTIVGINGLSFLQGNGVPSNGYGQNGDSYLDIDTYDIYLKTNGIWNVTGNIKGADGNDGANGVGLIVNEQIVATTTSLLPEILKTVSIPANTFASNGDSILLELNVLFAKGSDSAVVLNFGSTNGQIAGAYQGNVRAQRSIFRLTKASATSLWCDWTCTSFASALFGYTQTGSSFTTSGSFPGTYDFTLPITLSITVTDSHIAGDTSINVFRITKYKI